MQCTHGIVMEAHSLFLGEQAEFDPPLSQCSSILLTELRKCLSKSSGRKPPNVGKERSSEDTSAAPRDSDPMGPSTDHRSADSNAAHGATPAC